MYVCVYVKTAACVGVLVQASHRLRIFRPIQLTHRQKRQFDHVHRRSKKRSSMPKATIRQVETGGRVCISYLRGDAKKFRELSLAYEKKFPPRAPPL